MNFDCEEQRGALNVSGRAEGFVHQCSSMPPNTQHFPERLTPPMHFKCLININDFIDIYIIILKI